MLGINIFRSRIKSYILIGFVVFVMMVILSFYLTYQQYQIIRTSQKDATLHELHNVKDNLTRTFMFDFSATKTLAFIVGNYGVPKNFDSVAKVILESNNNIDLLQLTRKGVITHVYPHERNEKVIGYDILKDPERNKEAFTAIERRALYWTKPVELKQGGIGIIGRRPIFIDNEFFGFAVVITKLPTFLKSAGIDAVNGRFLYQLSRIDPVTRVEEFFLPEIDEGQMQNAVSATILNTDWKLYVAERNYKSPFSNVIMFVILALIFSFISGFFAFYLAKQPEKLRELVRKKTLQLSESEKYYRSLIEKSSDAIVLIDLDGKLLYQSPSAEKMFGYAIKDLQTLHLLELVHPEDKKRLTKTFAMLLHRRGSIHNKIYRVKTSNGRFLWLEGTFTNQLHDSTIQSIIFNFHDVTKRVEDELVLKKITSDLMQRNTDLLQFAYIVSHNLRSPVANILGLANILDYTESEAERKQVQGFLFAAIEKMDEIIKDLNSILQVRNENTENRELIDLDEMVKSVSAGIENTIIKEQVQILTDFSSVHKIKTSKSYLHSILHNLILNSIKYRSAERQPVIHIKTDKLPGKIEISFRDNGRGIDLKQNGKDMFRLYKRFHLDVEGKGVGLYMVKTQVEAVGGTIEVKSRLNEGTEFIITFIE